MYYNFRSKKIGKKVVEKAIQDVVLGLCFGVVGVAANDSIKVLIKVVDI